MVGNCSTNSTIVFREDVDYQMLSVSYFCMLYFSPWRLDRTPINFGTLNNVEVELLGNILFPQNTTYVQQVVNASSANSYWITMKGNQVTFSGNPLNPFGGTVNGFGQAWYEAAAKTLPLGGLVRVSPQSDFYG
jgi:hypothetical protein